MRIAKIIGIGGLVLLAGFITFLSMKLWGWQVQKFERPVIQSLMASEALDIAESRRREDALARKVIQMQYQLDVLSEGGKNR